MKKRTNNIFAIILTITAIVDAMWLGVIMMNKPTNKLFIEVFEKHWYLLLIAFLCVIGAQILMRYNTKSTQEHER